MPESNFNVERSRRIRKDIQGKSALRQCAIEVILIVIVRLGEIITIGHTLIHSLSTLASNSQLRPKTESSAAATAPRGV
jgi:hypothetical protein